MREKTKQKILDFINTLKEPVNLRELSEKLKMSQPTIQKYVDVLSTEKAIKVKDYHSMKLVSRRQNV